MNMINKHIILPKTKKITLLSILILFIPSLFALFYCVINTQLPQADGTDYILVVANLYDNFKKLDIGNFIASIYTDRGWRPVTFPLLMLPFMLISKGNLYFSYSAVVVLSIFIGALYSYLLLNITLTRFSSLLGACVISLSPILFQLGFGCFFIEVSLFPCLLACYYYLIKSDFLNSRKESYIFSFLLAFAVTLRPVETVIHILLPISIFLIIGLRKKKFTINELYIAILSILIGVTFLLSKAIQISMMDDSVINKDPHMNIIYVLIFKVILAITAIAILLLLLSFVKEKIHSYIKQNYFGSEKNYLVLAFAISTTFSVFWWGPYIQRLTEWTYMTSIGGLAKGYVILPKNKVILNILYYCGYINFVLIVFVTLLAFFVFSLEKIKKIVLHPSFFYLVLTMPIPLLLTLFSTQTSPRKMAIAMPFFSLALLQLGLQNGRFWKIRNFTILILFVSQIIALLLLMFSYLQGKNSKNWLLKNSGMLTITRPITVRPNPNDVTFLFLKENAEKFHLKNIAAQISTESKPTADPFLLSAMMKIYHLSFSVNYPYYDQFSREKELEIYKHYDAMLLINPFGKNDDIKKHRLDFYRLAEKSPPWEKITFDTLAQFAEGKIGSLGWVKGPCYTFKIDKEYEGCLFLKKL